MCHLFKRSNLLLLVSCLLYWLLSTSVLQRDTQDWPISSSHGCVGKCWYFTFLTPINVDPLPQSSSQTAATQAGTQNAAVLLILQKYLLEKAQPWDSLRLKPEPDYIYLHSKKVRELDLLGRSFC